MDQSRPTMEKILTNTGANPVAARKGLEEMLPQPAGSPYYAVQPVISVMPRNDVYIATATYTPRDDASSKDAQYPANRS